MIQAYIQDIARVVTVTPNIDVTGQVVEAQVYDCLGKYIGVANTVKADISSSVKLNLTNGGAGVENITVRVLAKLRYEESYTEIVSETVDVAVGTDDYTVEFDQEEKLDVRVEFSAIGANIVVNSFNVESKQFTSLEDVVVGGASGVEVAIPCDFRDFEPGDDYSLVFVAGNYGVLAKEILTIYDGSGYGTGS